ncbi:MAG TPA: SufE family protein [Rariglobus sp.]
MSVSDTQARLIEDLSFIEDRQERLAAIVDRARRRPPLPESARTEANRVHGCISQVWVAGEVRGGRLHFQFDADSPLVKGLVALLVDLYEAGAPADIVATEPVLLNELGINRDLTPTRQNGLAAVRARIKSLAQSALPA